MHGEDLQRFRTLVAAYPTAGIHGARQLDAQTLFATLTPGERETAILKARSYAASLQGGDRRVMSLQTWLRQTDFAPPPAGRASPPDDAKAVPRGIALAIAPPPSPAEPLDREAEALRQVAEGLWPRFGTVFVAADSDEGRAWDAHFARFDRPALWMTLGPEGRGWPMPCAWPPGAFIEI